MSHRETPPLSSFAALAARFRLHGEVIDARAHGSGHINDTFAVTFSQAGTPLRYIFQRINDRIFTKVPELMENIDRVISHQKSKLAKQPDASRRSLTLVPANDGAPFLRDEKGAWWRVYLFIEHVRTYDRIDSAEQAWAAARAFGEFQRNLADLPGGRLHETIPAFHDTPRRYADFEAAVERDHAGRLKDCPDEVAFARAQRSLSDRLLQLQREGKIPERVTHNDTKINNVMLDEKNGEGICVIDLDTVMPGLSLYDFGDMVRFATNAALEDETDLSKVYSRREIFEALVRGFLAGAGDSLNACERAHLALSGQVITYEIGLRFLADYLDGDIYFKTGRPAHNLDRARNQFALLRSLQEQAAEFEGIVESIQKETHHTAS